MTEFNKKWAEIVLEQYLSGEKLEELKEYDLKHLIELVNEVYTEPYKNARVLHELLYGILLMDTILSKEDMVYINKNVLDIVTMDTVVKTINEAIMSNKNNVLLKLHTTDKTIKFLTEMIEEKGFVVKNTKLLLKNRKPGQVFTDGFLKKMEENTHVVILRKGENEEDI